MATIPAGGTVRKFRVINRGPDSVLTFRLRGRMFEELEEINRRPKPFEFYDAESLWTDEHTSGRMLSYHLDENVDIASRKVKFIDRSVEWMTSRFNIDTGLKIADFGCGPGLYAARLARRNATVTGIDFSKRSINYAKHIASREKLDIRYIHGNYLDLETDEQFDLVLLIMCDLCALSPVQRKALFQKFKRVLKPNGHVLLDVYSFAAFEKREEKAVCRKNLLDGFWSAKDYYGFLNVFKYPAEKVILDKYTIVGSGSVRTVCNWLQYFSPESLEKEITDCGLCMKETYANVAGAPFDPAASEFAAVIQERQDIADG